MYILLFDFVYIIYILKTYTFPQSLMDLSLIQEVGNCSEDDAMDILEVIEQVMPMSPEGRELLQQPLSVQIAYAKKII